MAKKLYLVVDTVCPCHAEQDLSISAIFHNKEEAINFAKTDPWGIMYEVLEYDSSMEGEIRDITKTIFRVKRV